MNKKLIMICVLFLLGLVITIKQTNSTPPYEVDPHTFDQNGEITCTFYAGENIYISAQVNENNLPVSGKEVYIHFVHRNTGRIVPWGNMGLTTDAQGRTYAIVPVSWFESPYCGDYVLFAQVWEGGQFVLNQGWTSVGIFPAGCTPPSVGGCGPSAGGSPFIFKKRKVVEINT